jgi:hypothetical protein
LYGAWLLMFRRNILPPSSGWRWNRMFLMNTASHIA